MGKLSVAGTAQIRREPGRVQRRQETTRVVMGFQRPPSSPGCIWIASSDQLNCVGLFDGGSAYRLFHIELQVHRTINQRDTECFIVGFDVSKWTLEVTHVSVLGHILMVAPRDGVSHAPRADLAQRVDSRRVSLVAAEMSTA
ncbi:Aste57867_14329 [Aphanomyces stellatus]|uniref:Aste57867_14329 protein n=1 Tax=Aphanomyces stellatus TaxID=120398 RepID=A0A485L159_9STRA|nr:hypothetical protein As57867_014275 [Aphanomyces stellatus]VFT91153.1 Aste57867_14329 [Aphanomyces stellatus]